MLVRSHVHPELELIRWLALIVLAAALALLLATQAAGANSLPRGAEVPRTLPPQIDQWARPLSETPLSENPLSEPPLSETWDRDDASHFETVEWIWRAIESHRSGDPMAALDAWRMVHLPPSTRVWQHVAMSMAFLQSHQTDEAARALAMARSLEPENPLVTYMTGILRLDQAEDAAEWYDAVSPAVIRLAVQQLDEIAPNTRSMYELSAIQAFERTIEWAPRLRRDLPLVPVHWGLPEDYETVMPLAAPRVGDVLQVIGAEQFLGKSHWVLGEMYLERGTFEHAEEHLDRARVERVPTGVAYRKLGRAYEEADMHSDAARAYLKAMSPDAGVVGPAEKALENFRNALRGIW